MCVIFLLFLLASQKNEDFFQSLKSFDLSKCVTYTTTANPFTGKSEDSTLALYVSENSNVGNNVSSCFVITNGYSGKNSFFDALYENNFCGWSNYIHPQANFFGLKGSGTNDGTYAVIGNIASLIPDVSTVRNNMKPCLEWQLYLRKVERRNQDEQARRVQGEQARRLNLNCMIPLQSELDSFEDMDDFYAAITATYDTGRWTQEEVAHRFNCSQPTVSRAVKVMREKGFYDHAVIAERFHHTGESAQKIAEYFGCSESTVYRAIRSHPSVYSGGNIISSQKSLEE
jgi:predicted transcriptional regulator